MKGKHKIDNKVEPSKNGLIYTHTIDLDNNMLSSDEVDKILSEIGLIVLRGDFSNIETHTFYVTPENEQSKPK